MVWKTRMCDKDCCLEVHHYCSFILSFHILGSQKSKISNMLNYQMKYLDLKENTKALLSW